MLSSKMMQWRGIIAFLACPVIAFPCDCGPAGPACAYVGRAAAVFTGKVVFTDHDPALGIRQRTFVRFEVEEAFKGLPSGTRDVWIDPGSFTSCYAEYNVGQRLLVFAYGGSSMPPDTSMMSVVPGQARPKRLPTGIDPANPPVVYSAPECSGTRLLTENDRGLFADLDYLRRYSMGNAHPSVQGRVLEDADFGIFEAPGLPNVLLKLLGMGINRSAQTDADGYYVFDDVPLGTYTLTPSLRPYFVLRGDFAPPGEREVAVAKDSCGTANFDMTAPGVIRGTLLGHSGQPAPNVRIEVLRLDKQGKPVYYGEKATKTDQNGRFRFVNLPGGDFEVGVNVFEAPDPETPYSPTKWSENSRSSIHLTAGERKMITPFRLPARSAVRVVEAEVHWPDGSPAQGVTVWGDVGDRAAASGDTNANGVAHFKVLQGIRYTIEANIWVGSQEEREVARSGSMELTPGSDPIHLKLTLSERSKYF